MKNFKILILDNFFNLRTKNTSLYLNYKRSKLNSLIKKEFLRYGNNVRLKIISNSKNRINIKENVEFELLSDYRLNIERDEYIYLENEVRKKNDKIIDIFFKSFSLMNNFQIYGYNIIDLIEHSLSKYYKELLGEIEIFKRILNKESYNKIILFNFDINFLKNLQKLKINLKNIEYYDDLILNSISQKQDWINLIKFIIYRLIFYQKGTRHYTSKENNILFIVKSLNALRSVNSVYRALKKKKKFNPNYYIPNIFIPKIAFLKFIRFLIQIGKLWNNYRLKLFQIFHFESIKLEFTLKKYYIKDFLPIIITFFNYYQNFIKFHRKNPLALVILANWIGVLPNTYAKYCKKNNIPTIYIPHSAEVRVDDLKMRSVIDYLTVSGERDKEYFISKGIGPSRIVVSGRPIYERFFKNQVNVLHSLNDIYNNRIYKLKKNEFKILFTSVKKTDIKTLSIIINCLRELGLSENLIIKLHPLENENNLKKTLSELNIDILTVKNCDILNLIKTCDLLLSGPSTTILEAMIIGTPIILLNFVNYNFVNSYSYVFLDEEKLLKVNNQTELKNAIEILFLNKDKYEKYSKNIQLLSKKCCYFNSNNTPTAKIVHLIEKILENEKLYIPYLNPFI